MLLTVGIIGVVVVVLGCGVFLGLAQPELPAQPLQKRPERGVDVPQPSFFVAPLQRRVATVAQPQRPDELPVPVELLLRELEEHIRAENSAAEAFAAAPSATSLHGPPRSKFLN